MPRQELWAILPPLAVFVAALSLFNALDLCIRYLLPAVPLLYLLAGSCFAALGGAAGRVVAAAAPLYAAATVWLVHPSYIGYFNPAAGGPGEGHRWLLDSNLDWGRTSTG